MTNSYGQALVQNTNFQYPWPQLPAGTTRFTMFIKGNNDAYITLSPRNCGITDDERNDVGIPKIVIGGYHNQKSGFLCSSIDDHAGWEQFPSPNILSTTEEREFFVQFVNNSLQIGKVGEAPFMTVNYSCTVDIKYVGIASGYDGDVDWKYCVLQEFNVTDASETYSLCDGISTTKVSMSDDVPEYGSSLSLGILKSAHVKMNLSHLNLQSQQKNGTSYEFGSKITGINLFGEDDEFVSLRNGSRVEMTLGLLPRITPRTATTLVIPVCYYFSHLGVWSEDGCRTIKVTISHVTCSCDHMTSFAVLMQLIDIEIPLVHQYALHNLTVVGIAISSVCLIITLALYGYLRMYRQPRVVIHANLAFSILIGQLIFVFGIDATPKTNCIAVTILLHYAYTAVFIWMLMEGVFLYIKMKPTIKWSLKPSVCMPIAWGIPIIITLLTFGIRHRMYGSNDVCWLPINRGVIYAFVGPALVIVGINTVILYLTLETFKNLKTIREKKEKERFRAIARALAILEPLLGLTWVFGVLQFDKTSAVVFSYLFGIFNTSQGIFILLWQCLMDEDVAKVLRRRFGKRVDNHNDSPTRKRNTTEMAQVQIQG
ncbi:adhesion G protein-coupled receptor L3-like [Amphiura filiformis]|uniref:adhesion G protein-coupled receptor L3-like n=1 Tax=Amphiura filiformis TaxID=82378 RepID=UPI003B20C6B1